MKAESNIISLSITQEYDVVFARQRARQIAKFLKFNIHDQTRIATAVSEIARNAFLYAKGGRIEFKISYNTPQKFLIYISDSGPGIANITEILAGLYQSKTGMGLGIIGSKKLLGDFQINTSSEGTIIRLGLPISNILIINNELIARLVNELVINAPQNPLEELRTQNHELIQTLESIQQKQEELSQLNKELENTNRGVVALYAELDEKAKELKRANSIKTRFLANMTHEFRTPLNSVMNLCRLLMDKLDGPLTDGQEKQVQLIYKAAESLSELVNDLLDIAKVEAGKIQVRPQTFTVNELFTLLRGLFLSSSGSNPGVKLSFHEEPGLPPLFTDEGKLSQVLKNFISNAMKYTEAGDIKVSAETLNNGTSIKFSVKDSGIGIAYADQERIFMEFEQIDSPLQIKKKGTGLGLPLAMQLSKLLGGEIQLESRPGNGSTFSVSIPCHYVGPSEGDYLSGSGLDNLFAANPHFSLLRQAREGIKLKALIIDDEEAPRYILKHALMEVTDFEIEEATGGLEGLVKVIEFMPDIVFLDLVMPDMLGTEVLKHLKTDKSTAHIPVILYSAKELDSQEREGLKLISGSLPKGRDKLKLIKAIHDLLPQFERMLNKPKEHSNG